MSNQHVEMEFYVLMNATCESHQRFFLFRFNLKATRIEL
jgi:hypothetical protein